MKLSIIIPNYNYAQHIGHTITSVIEQDYYDVEIIIIDDGSTDNSREIITKFVDLYPNKIRFFSQSNKGQASAINLGLKMATGQIIGWINSDDYYCKNVFSRIIQCFWDFPHISIVYGNINIVDINNNFIYTLRHFKFSYVDSVFCGFSNNLSSNAVFWRRDYTKEIEQLDESFKCGLDREFFSRLTYKSEVMKINLVIANFRIQPYTIASKKELNWDELVNHESNKVFEKSYQKLSVNKYFNHEFGKKIALLFILRKKVKRVFYGYYFKERLEKAKYKKRITRDI